MTDYRPLVPREGQVPSILNVPQTTAQCIRKVGGPSELLAWCRARHQLVLAKLAPIDVRGTDDNNPEARDLRMENAVYRVVYDTLTSVPDMNIDQVYKMLISAGVEIPRERLGDTMVILNETLGQHRQQTVDLRVARGTIARMQHHRDYQEGRLRDALDAAAASDRALSRARAEHARARRRMRNLFLGLSAFWLGVLAYLWLS